ncbi:MAG: PDZ domain-containing protein [Bacteroidetes bacterium]|nr:PDZ domain-containing protein [Bacteroidota bacterium]MBU1115236.1 PDZ domain-containing protein [Bacteroidota bacterium]MBU1797254.1 PDZ domain-containing protein [Bacteroidota bacterium]
MKKSIFTTTALIMLFFTITTNSQQMKIITGNEIAFVPEIKGIIEFGDSQLKVAAVQPSSQESEKPIDLKVDDIVLFVNGKRVKTLDSFNENYENTTIGEEVKLGIKRGDERFIVSFKKADPTKFKHKIMRMGKNAEHADEAIGSMKKEKVMMNIKEVDADSLKQNKVIINMESPNKKEDK